MLAPAVQVANGDPKTSGMEHTQPRNILVTVVRHSLEHGPENIGTWPTPARFWMSRDHRRRYLTVNAFS